MTTDFILEARYDSKNVGDWFKGAKMATLEKVTLCSIQAAGSGGEEDQDWKFGQHGFWLRRSAMHWTVTWKRNIVIFCGGAL